MPTKKTTPSSTSKPAAKAPASKAATKAPASAAAAKPAKAAKTASSGARQLAKTAAKTVAKKATKTASQAIKDLTKPAAKATPAKRTARTTAAATGAAVAGAVAAKRPASALRTEESSSVYQLKITLLDTDPAIWRRVQVKSDIHLGQLHEIIQTVMGWEFSHLHAYRPAHNHLGVFPDETYLITDLSMMGDEDETNLDETGFRLEQVLQNPKEYIVYEYDFGDSWEHEIRLEKILPPNTALAAPSCLEGEGACPPEDIGGVWGYYEVLAALADKDHPEHAEMMEYYGKMNLDQQRFGAEEIALVNTELSARFAADD
ncbi:plasmid pRiA4b ORF-3 family protein [Thiorhodospira sibirica]|uniref:plasmid pRiA4b ORF-3 family protein n=1 Tax=Thiorhodospira sibirica TaxID=154347 RepID=UPI00022C33E7|nr:plasmid pRiA4b ORF-3 family protein [Thiorhodospira sibirica]